jgi:hypothetical protein
MIKALLIGHLVLAMLFVAWIATRPWRIVLDCLFCDAHNLDRLCAGVAGLGLLVLVVHRRPAPVRRSP